MYVTLGGDFDTCTLTLSSKTAFCNFCYRIWLNKQHGYVWDFQTFHSHTHNHNYYHEYDHSGSYIHDRDSLENYSPLFAVTIIVIWICTYFGTSFTKYDFMISPPPYWPSHK